MNLLSALSPATLRVLAAALIYERRFGRRMGPAALNNLCRRHEASEGAAMAIVLQKGFNAEFPKPGEKQFVDLAYLSRPIRVLDEETEAALDWGDGWRREPTERRP